MQEDKDCPPFSREGHGPKSTDKPHNAPCKFITFYPFPALSPNLEPSSDPCAHLPEVAFSPAPHMAYHLIFLSSHSPAPAWPCSPFNEVVL